MIKQNCLHRLKGKVGAVEMMEAAAVICLLGLALVAIGPYIKNHVQGKLFESSKDFSRHNFSVSNHQMTRTTTSRTSKQNTEKLGVINSVSQIDERVTNDMQANNINDQDVNVGQSASTSVLY